MSRRRSHATPRRFSSGVRRERQPSLARLSRMPRRTARAGSFTLLGPAGIGKSRLVADFLERVGDSADVLRGRCLSYGEGITYWPLVEILIAIGVEPDSVIGRLRRRRSSRSGGSSRRGRRSGRRSSSSTICSGPSRSSSTSSSTSPTSRAMRRSSCSASRAPSSSMFGRTGAAAR